MISTIPTRNYSCPNPRSTKFEFEKSPRCETYVCNIVKLIVWAMRRPVGGEPLPPKLAIFISEVFYLAPKLGSGRD